MNLPKLLPACVTLLVGFLCSCDQITTEMSSSCHTIGSSIDQKVINRETAKSQASIDSVVVECLPLKDAASYKFIATAKITTKIEEGSFQNYGPLTDAIRFEALSSNGTVIGREEVNYRMPRLIRSENVTAVFKDLSAAEMKSITKVVAGWIFQ